MRDLLVKSVENVVESPCAFAEMSAESVTEIIVAHDLTQRVHPTLETAVHKRAVVGDGVAAITTGSIALFTVTAVEDNVEVDEVEVLERCV